MFGLPFIDNWFAKIRPALYDDVVDRLNYYATTIMLMFFAIMVSAKQYVGSPIQCWTPAHFKGGWEQYAEDYCFVQSTYFVPLTDQVAQNVEVRKEKMELLGYYQWVPIVLAVQALLFYIPYFFWKSLNFHSGINLKSVMQRAVRASNADLDKRDEELKKVASYLQESLGLHHNDFTRRCWRQKHYGCYVTCLYIFTKFLYLVNIVIQFLILNSFLGSDYTFWGVQILYDLIRGNEWHVSGHFPRTTLCDFEVRAEISNIQRHTIQCVLMINMFNEKIYIFIWFWLFFLGIVTGLNFLYWCVISLSERFRTRYLLNCIEEQPMPDSPYDKRKAREFAAKTLPADGILVLRFIESHAGDWTSRELVLDMWRHFQKQNSADAATMQRGGQPSVGENPSESSKFSSPMYNLAEYKSNTKLLGNDECGLENEYVDGAGKVFGQRPHSAMNGGVGHTQPLLPHSIPLENGHVRRNGYPGAPPLYAKPKPGDRTPPGEKLA